MCILNGVKTNMFISLFLQSGKYCLLSSIIARSFYSTTTPFGPVIIIQWINLVQSAYNISIIQNNPKIIV